VNAVVIARQQDKNKDKHYLLPLRSGQLHCHGRRYTLNVLAAKKRKIAKKVRKYLRHENLETPARFLI
jgi:hypothetical protein